MLGRVGGAICLDQSERMEKNRKNLKSEGCVTSKSKPSHCRHMTNISIEQIGEHEFFGIISYTHLDTCTHLSLVYFLSVKHATKTTPLKN